MDELQRLEELENRLKALPDFSYVAGRKKTLSEKLDSIERKLGYLEARSTHLHKHGDDTYGAQTFFYMESKDAAEGELRRIREEVEKNNAA